MEEIKTLITASVKDLFNIEIEPELTRTDEQFGDYSTNVAMKLVGKISDLSPAGPRETAQNIAEKLQAHQGISKIEVAGPGYINITLDDEMLINMVNKEIQQPLSGQTVVIETNNPNPFKAMHIGHAFNAILGDSIANLIETAGANTYRVSYHGDVGLHVGKSMYSLLQFTGDDPNKLNTVPQEERNSFMSRMYAEGSRAYKDNEAAKAKIDELAEQSFTREDPLYAAVYEICKDWSFEQIDDTVKRLGNTPTTKRFLESEADARGVKIVQDNVPKVFKESRGALVFEGSKYGSFDNVFVGSNGRGLYGARDLGLIQLKNEEFHPNRSYIVTAEEQRDYFKGVIAAAELCMPSLKNVTVNIPHGTVKLTTGKMSSRSGDVVEINWLYEKVSESARKLSGKTSEDVITGALRYQFQKVRVGSDVIFDVEEAVSLQGNSGPYLQYAHARAMSILSKKPLPNEKPDRFEPGERSLLRKITEYPEVVNKSIYELMPHYVCIYLHELAQNFNRFYEKNRVIDDPREPVRLQLVQAYADTLKKGLRLLNIPAPDKM